MDILQRFRARFLAKLSFIAAVYFGPRNAIAGKCLKTRVINLVTFALFLIWMPVFCEQGKKRRWRIALLNAGVGVVQIFSGLEHNTTINICSLLKNTATKVTANVLSDEHNARLKVSTAANWGTSNSQHFMSACVHISHNNWLLVTQLLKLNCPWGGILTKCPLKCVGPWFGDCEGQATGRAWTGGAWGCWCTRW